MVDWLAGKRVKGTSSERTTGTWTGLPSGSVGGWVEVGRSTSTSPDITNIPDKRYYMILHSGLGWSSGANGTARFNGENGNHATRYNRNGTGETGVGNTGQGYDWIGTGNEDQVFSVGYVANYASKEKLHIVHSVASNTGAAGTAPSRNEIVNKYVNSTAINRIQTNTSGSGSEMVVLGWDPADTHTNNFWQELASVELSSASDTLSSGTITAKKYLWVQTFVKATGGTVEPDSRFNNDNSGTNNVSGTYADRYSINGGSDGTGTNLNKGVRGSGVPVSAFFNDFIINNASNEKLVIRHVNYVSTAGAGYAPNMRETVGKWSNTSNQITDITWHDESGSGAQMDSGSFIKVWGAD